MKYSFLLIRKVSEKGRENMRSIRAVTRKGAVTSNTIFGFSLHVRFINDNELCSVPGNHWNFLYLT